jgi:branched-chain amino acid transport system permease protein
MAVGLAMVFGILRLINFAHGDMMMVAAYLAVFALIAGQPVIVVLVLMVGGTVLIGLIMERVGYRPIRGAPEVAALLTSFAIGQILQNGTLLTTRLMNMRSPYPFPAIDFLSGVFTVGSITIPKLNAYSLIALSSCWACSRGCHRTNLGLSMRAALKITGRAVDGHQHQSRDRHAFAIEAGLALSPDCSLQCRRKINPTWVFAGLKAFIACVIGGLAAFKALSWEGMCWVHWRCC